MYSDNYWISIFDAVPTWVMLLPIFICSIIGAAAIIERILLYNRINADYTMLINNVAKEYSNNIQQALLQCKKVP
ncbi:MAG TPA: hypothetical protein PLH80_12490, partial [Spirochaetota bacterium]|nr:hypothetical protein [Spirochaetota bacterium]